MKQISNKQLELIASALKNAKINIEGQTIVNKINGIRDSQNEFAEKVLIPEIEKAEKTIEKILFY